MSSSFNDIRNVYCIGRNYALHAKELGNDVPTEPMVFMKPTHALVSPEGVISFPTNQGEIHHEVELVVKLSQHYSPTLPLAQVIDSYALGIDFTLRDKQSELKKKGHPWLVAKGFHNSGILSSWNPFNEQEWNASSFGLTINGNPVQHGTPNDMIFDLKTLMNYIHEHLGLGAGDIIYTGTPAGVGPIAHNDKLTLKLNNEIVGEFTVELN